jgi:hypothetical protein
MKIILTIMMILVLVGCTVKYTALNENQYPVTNPENIAIYGEIFQQNPGYKKVPPSQLTQPSAPQEPFEEIGIIEILVPMSWSDYMKTLRQEAAKHGADGVIIKEIQKELDLSSGTWVPPLTKVKKVRASAIRFTAR